MPWRKGHRVLRKRGMLSGPPPGSGREPVIIEGQVRTPLQHRASIKGTARSVFRIKRPFMASCVFLWHRASIFGGTDTENGIGQGVLSRREGRARRRVLLCGPMHSVCDARRYSPRWESSKTPTASDKRPGTTPMRPMPCPVLTYRG
eukprot:1570349-Rhodomonas_salina.1